MKGLAEFVMRGRLQAVLVTMAGAGSMLFCWLSAAVIALVTLRLGAGQGLWLLFWALLPSGTLMLVFGDSGPLLLLFGTTVLAVILRSTINLSLAVLCSVGLGIASGLALLLFGDQNLAQLAQFFDEFLSSLEQQLAAGGNGEVVELARPTAVQIAGMLGVVNAVLSVLCLLLARWWQALLYNPQGFGQEFREVYFPPLVATVLVLTALALFSLGSDLRSWAVIVIVPLCFAGLALVHAGGRLRAKGKGWFVVFYAALLFFDPVKLLIVCAAVVDSWVNFRRRWAVKAQSGSGGNDDSQDSD